MTTNLSTIGNPVLFVESRFGIQLKKVGRDEWAGPCPWCGGNDRFHIWEAGNYWCRPGASHCGRTGWLDSIDGIKPLARDELLELRVAALEREQAEMKQTLDELVAQMHKSTDHLRYHEYLRANDSAIEYWLDEGIGMQFIERYRLGYCPDCPTARGRESYTIPVMTGNGKTLWNIRHRLVNGGNGDKYRPHVTGLPAMLFNTDTLHTNDRRFALILEGEKKAMVVTQEVGVPNVATMGMASFKTDWTTKLARFETVYVAYDPDAYEKAVKVAGLFGKRGRVVKLPAKADDFFVKYGGTKEQFLGYVYDAWRVN